MQLSTIQADGYFLLGGSAAPDDYSSTDQLRNINNWYDVAVDMILQSMPDWAFNDNIATTNLVGGTRAYTLSAASLSISAVNLLQINRVEISYDGVNYYRASPIPKADIASALADSQIDSKAGLSDTAAPRYYLGEDSITIFPSPGANVTNGLKIYYTKAVTALSSAGDVPLIPSIFFRLLSLGMAYDYAFSRGLPNADRLRMEIENYKIELKSFMSIKVPDEKIIASVGNLSQYEY